PDRAGPHFARYFPAKEINDRQRLPSNRRERDLSHGLAHGSATCSSAAWKLAEPNNKDDAESE
ncbi:MAG: hypothetical protein WCF18_07295, partial [Chthoniobacteraceae bacterium]